MPSWKGLNQIVEAEHLDVENGESINAKKVVPYGIGTDLTMRRVPIPLIDGPWDYLSETNPDTNGNYQTITFLNGGSGGTTVRTLSLTYDANGNVTTLART